MRVIPVSYLVAASRIPVGKGYLRLERHLDTVTEICIPVYCGIRLNRVIGCS